MKTLRYIMLVVMMTIVTSVSAMTYSQAKDQALFLADKMAYELDLTDEQYEAAYEINLDYLMSVNDYDDIYGSYWTRRNLELRSILAGWQYEKYVAAEYFYRPVYWSNNRWCWRIYSYYTDNRYFRTRPTVYVTYRGGNAPRYYTSRTWSKPSTRPTARVESGSRTWSAQTTAPKGNNGNRTFGNGNRMVNNRTTNVNVTNVNVNNNSRLGNYQPSTIANRTTQTMNGNRSFGSRQTTIKSSSNASNRTFGRR